MTGFNNNVPTKFPKHLTPKGPDGPELLEAERAKASFNVKAVSKFMYGEEVLEKMQTVARVLESEPAFEKTQRYYQGRPERIAHAYEKDKRLIELTKYDPFFYILIITNLVQQKRAKIELYSSYSCYV